MRLLTRIVAGVLACSLLFFAGCDSLNLQPKDELGSEQVFQDAALARAYLNDVYSRTGVGFGDPMPTPGIVDEALNTHNHPGDQNVLSTLTPGNRGIWDSPGWRAATSPYYEHYYWPEVYSSIRDLNLFLREAAATDALPAEEKETLLGEAYFLKAYFYHNLMKLYGGVPLLNTVFELQGDISDYQVERGTFAETIDFIVADLDSAASMLSTSARRPGAATRGAALALKSRVLLFAASDLYNNSPFSGSDAAQFVSYQGGSQQDRWQAAKDAAQAVIDLGVYSLEQTTTAHQYHELFTKGNQTGTIWARYFNENATFTHNHSQFVSPNGYNSWSGDTPTQQHVDAYEIADGSQFQWEGADPESASEPVDAENPYDDRDPRFYANISFNNADWRSRPAGLAQIDPRGVVQTGWYEVEGQESLRAGLDTRESPNQSWNGTRTGYNLRKFVDRDIDPAQQQAYNPWIYIRYAEVLLNYAEASANLNQPGEAVWALNKVRSRVGMPPVPEDGGPNRTLMERIRQEREVELAFEGHRYFDVRRWKMGEEAYQDAQGIRVIGHLVDESHPEAQRLVDNYYNYHYNVVSLQNRAWQDKNYFVPISNGEMDRNPNLVQNPGYN